MSCLIGGIVVGTGVGCILRGRSSGGGQDIIGVVSDNHTNIISANVKSKGKVGIIELGIELDNIDTLRKVMTAIQAMPEVFSVKRIQTSYASSNNQNFSKKQNNSKKKRPKPNN
mgnify:CR=1 FL=1